MIHPVAKVLATVLAVASVVLAAMVVLNPGDDPLNVLAIPVILIGTLLTVVVVLFGGFLAGAVAHAVRDLLRKHEVSPSD